MVCYECRGYMRYEKESGHGDEYDGRDEPYENEEEDQTDGGGRRVCRLPEEVLGQNLCRGTRGEGVQPTERREDNGRHKRR